MDDHSQFLNKLNAVSQDVSRPVLEELLADGYDTVLWNSSSSATDSICLALNGERWSLASFLANLQHDAPIYEDRIVDGSKAGSHPNCTCTVTVTGPGKEAVVVNAFGRIG